MKVLNFGDSEQRIFEVLAAILHLGNIQFRKKDDTDAADFVNKDCKFK